VKREGPLLETLTRRLAETPADFLAEPRVGAQGAVEVGAVVGDLLRLLGSVAVREADLLALAGRDVKRDRNRLAVSLLLSWLLAEPWFQEHPPEAGELLALMSDGAQELAAFTAAPRFVDDPDHREELARFALARVGLRPAGETMAQAQDRLTTLSASERARVLAASREAEKRARAIREALARKAAEESADKWTRE
jgi:hypothetical protein